MRRKLLTLLTMTLIGIAPTTYAQQLSSGLRGMATENDALAWQAVGRLDADAVGFCTATLIAPDLVLTAAHCLFSSKTGQKLEPGDLTFRAGLRQGTVAAKRTISQIEIHTGYDHRGGSVATNIRHDVALLRLETPIPTSELDPFILQERLVSSGPVSVVSYGRNRETLPSRQEVCQVMDARSGIMLLDCDVTFGSSGAPVFSQANGRGQIVSLISGGGVYNGRRVAYGMVLPKLVAELKQQIWANKSQPVASIRRIQVGSGGLGSRSGGAKFVRP